MKKSKLNSHVCPIQTVYIIIISRQWWKYYFCVFAYGIRPFHYSCRSYAKFRNSTQSLRTKFSGYVIVGSKNLPYASPSKRFCCTIWLGSPLSCWFGGILHSTKSPRETWQIPLAELREIRSQSRGLQAISEQVISIVIASCPRLPLQSFHNSSARSTFFFPTLRLRCRSVRVVNLRFLNGPGDTFPFF